MHVLLEALGVPPPILVNFVHPTHAVMRPDVEALEAPVGLSHQLLQLRDELLLKTHRVNQLKLLKHILNFYVVVDDQGLLKTLHAPLDLTEVFLVCLRE